MESHYEEIYRYVYQELLCFAYKQYIDSGENDDTFCIHPHILKKFKDKNLTEKILIQWWHNDGKTIYFDALKQSARNAGDRERWGSEVEIGALATVLNINIRWRKNLNQAGQQLGIGGGLVEHLTEAQIKILNDLGIGSVLHKRFCIYAFPKKKLLEEGLNSLGMEEQKTVLQLLNTIITEKRENILPEACQLNNSILYLQLMQRNIITYYEGSYRFVTNNDNNLDEKLIKARMQGVNDEMLRQKIVAAFKEDVSEFEVLHQGVHWIYLPPKIKRVDTPKLTKGTNPIIDQPTIDQLEPIKVNFLVEQEPELTLDDKFKDEASSFLSMHQSVEGMFTSINKTDCLLVIQYTAANNASINSTTKNQLFELAENLKSQLTKIGLIFGVDYFTSIDSDNKELTILASNKNIMSRMGVLLKEVGIGYCNEQQLAASSVFFKLAKKQSSTNKITAEEEHQIECSK